MAIRARAAGTVGHRAPKSGLRVPVSFNRRDRARRGLLLETAPGSPRDLENARLTRPLAARCWKIMCPRKIAGTFLLWVSAKTRKSVPESSADGCSMGSSCRASHWEHRLLVADSSPPTELTPPAAQAELRSQDILLVSRAKQPIEWRTRLGTSGILATALPPSDCVRRQPHGLAVWLLCGLLDFRLFGNLQGIINLDTQVSNGTLQLAVAQQELNGPEVLSFLVD